MDFRWRSWRARNTWLTLLGSITIIFASMSSVVSGGLILDSSRFGTRQVVGTDSTIEISLSGFQGRFFGHTVPNIWLAENGYLSRSDLTGSDFFSESLALNPSPRIAGFWDDIFVLPSDIAGPNQGIFFARENGRFIAATWSDVFLFNDLTAGEEISFELSRSFQTVWFESDTSLGNFGFKKDDIAFGFSGFSDGYIDATVGIRGDSEYFSIDDATGRPAGQAPGGVISTTRSNASFPNAHLLPWEDSKFLLFRSVEDESGLFTGYQVSIESFSTAVPEPTSSMLAGIGLFVLCLYKRKRLLVFAASNIR